MNRQPAPSLPAFIESMLPPGIDRYRIPVGDQEMHIMEMGRGRPVVLLHGNPTWGFLYRAVAHALAEQPFRLIMPDLIGLGLSSKPRSPAAHQLELHGRWLGHALDALDLEDLIFVGQDWGGPIGLHALSTRVHRVSGLVLLNTVIGPPSPGFRPKLFHRLSQMPVLSDLAFRVAALPQKRLGDVQGDRRSITRRATRAYEYPLRDLHDRAAPLGMARMVPDSLSHPSVTPLNQVQRFVEQFQGPSAVVWGERDPILGRLCSRVARHLQNAEVTRTQAGHFLQEEVPDLIAEAVVSVAARSARG